jgi:hypothetical protein
MPQTCTYCSSSINDGDAFCQNCGRQAVPANDAGALEENLEPAVAAVPAGALPAWAATAHTGGLPSAPPTRSVPSAAAAPSAANDIYTGQRLRYSVPPEPTFDPLGSSRFIVQVLLRAALYAMTYAAGWTVIAFLFLITNFHALTGGLTSSANDSEFSGVTSAAPSGGINGFGDFLLVVLFLFSLVLVISFWFLKIPIQLSEWKITVDGKAGAAPTVFSHIAAVLYERGTPIAPLRAQRFQVPPGGARDYLELQSYIFYGYVACFGYGQDLYIGWTFWSKLSPIRYVFMFIGRLWQSLFNRGSDLHVSLRYDSARALRETIHSATREGVDVAVDRLEARGQGIIGSAIPVTEHAGTQ